MKSLGALLILVVLGTATSAGWVPQKVETQADFRGLCVVDDDVVWVSGTKGTFVRTGDGGKSWTVGTVPGAEKLDFRDVQGFGKSTAYLMSAGPGDASRIYKTTDAGNTWKLQFTNPEKEGFLDSFGFWDENHGIAMGDPVRGKFQLIHTDDGGANWKALEPKTLPPALEKEGAFAASGTTLVTHGKNDVWFCTGGAKVARVFHSGDRGQTWTVSETPILAGTESAGIFSIAFQDHNMGIIVGGDYRKPKETGITAATTADGGKTWKALEKPFPFRSGVAWTGKNWVVVGSSGSNSSDAKQQIWETIDLGNWNSVGFTPAGTGWVVGPRGAIARFK